MNVLFYSALPTVRYGGVAGWMHRMAQALRAAGHRVHILTWGPAEPDAERWGPDVHSVRLDPWMAGTPVVRFLGPLLVAARAGRALLERHAIDVVHTVSVYEAWSAAQARGRGQAALVLTLHGDYVSEVQQRWRSRWRRRLYRSLERRAFRTAETVTTSSAWLAGRLEPELGGARAVVIPNGIEAHKPAGPADRGALGLPEGRRLALTVNSLYAPYRRRALRLLIEAAPRVLEAVPDLLFVVVGGVNDPLRDRALVAWAREQAHGLPFEFLGYRPGSPQELMAAADVYVHPSFLDNSPTAVLEAMALGRPIVTTQVGGIPELVTHGETGLLVPPEAEPLARAVVRLLSDRPLAQALGERARERARSAFSWERAAQRMEETYVRALAARRRPGGEHA